MINISRTTDTTGPACSSTALVTASFHSMDQTVESANLGTTEKDAQNEKLYCAATTLWNWPQKRGAVHEVRESFSVRHQRLCGCYNIPWRNSSCNSQRWRTPYQICWSLWSLLVATLLCCAEHVSQWWNNQEDMDFAHEGQGFPTWHRLYLLAWERALQEVNGDEDFALPYWDWTDNDLKELCTKEVLGENTGGSEIIEGKYFDGWYSICTAATISTSVDNGTRICDPKLHREDSLKRNPGKKTPLPKKENVDVLLRFEKYDLPPYSKYSSCNFRNMLQGFISTSTGFYSPKRHTLHNEVHLLYTVGGAMADVPSASNDTIFWLHHSFVDRIFEKWLRKYNRTGQQPVNSCLAYFASNHVVQYAYIRLLGRRVEFTRAIFSIILRNVE